MVNNRAIIGYSQKLYEFLRGSDSHELSEKAYVLKEAVIFGKKARHRKQRIYFTNSY